MAGGKRGAQIASMTGFGRSSGDVAGRAFMWELKSVNGRGLEPRFRLPAGFDRLEAACRKAIAATLSRGNVSCSLTLDPDPATSGFVVDQAALDAALTAIETIRNRIETAPPRPEGVLALRGVIEAPRQGAGETEPDGLLESALLAGFEEALAALSATRRQEGAALAGVIDRQLAEIQRLAAAGAQGAAKATAAFADRLKSQLRDLVELERLPPERLAQEAALLAVKADVREELDRLEAHIAAARELMADGGAVGRRIDFLTQELNREANTLCAKAVDLDLKQIGLDLKAAVDQLREQIQNVE